MFCYIKYCDLTIQGHRVSKVHDPSSESIRKAKSIVHYKGDRGHSNESTNWHTLTRLSSMNSNVNNTSEPEFFQLTSQLTYEKSHDLINSLLRINSNSGQIITEDRPLKKATKDSYESVMCHTARKLAEEVVTTPMGHTHEVKTHHHKNPSMRPASIKSFKALRKITTARNIVIPPVIPNDTNALLMINPDCYMQILLDYIREKLNIDQRIKIDVCDEDGNMMKLYELKPHDNASMKLEHRKTYTLVAYELDYNTNSYTTLSPLIRRLSKRESVLMLKLKHIVNSKLSGKKSTHSLNNYSMTSKSHMKLKLKSKHGSLNRKSTARST